MSKAHPKRFLTRSLNRFNFLGALFLALACVSSAQVPVALSPTPRMQFFSEVTPSVPLAGGKVCTFNAGTTTPAATYSDIGGVFQNSNPIVLDPSGFATIYLANQEYKFIVYDATGNNACPNTGVLQWSQDNVSAFQPVVGTQTIIFAGVTSDPTGQAGMVDYRTDLGRLRFFNSAWDSIPGLATIDIFTNKSETLDANTINCAANVAGQVARNNGTKLVCGAIQSADLPALTSSYANSATGTGLNLIAKLVGAPSTVQTTATTDISGAVGICISGCTNTGNAQISTVGQASCIFDGATTAGDYVQISPNVAGNCHDGGASFPATGGQVLGRVLSTAGGGTLTVALFGTEFRVLGNTAAVSSLQISAATNYGAGLGSAQTIVASVTSTGPLFVTITPVTSLIGTSCGTGTLSVTPQITWTAPGGTIETLFGEVATAGNANGTLDFHSGVLLPGGSTTDGSGFMIVAKAGTSVSYTTTSVNGQAGCATTPQYTVYAKAVY